MIKLGEHCGWIYGHSSVCHSLKTQYLGQHQWDFTNTFFLCRIQKFYWLAQKKCIIMRCCLHWSLFSLSLCPSPAVTRGNTLSAPCHITALHHLQGATCVCCLCLFLSAFFFFFPHRPAALAVSCRFVLPVSHRLTIIVSRNTNKQQLARSCCMMTVIHHLAASSRLSAANTPLKLWAVAWKVCVGQLWLPFI